MASEINAAIITLTAGMVREMISVAMAKCLRREAWYVILVAEAWPGNDGGNAASS